MCSHNAVITHIVVCHFPLTLKTLAWQARVAKGAPVSLVLIKTLYACAWLVITTVTAANVVRVVSISISLLAITM